MIASQHPLLPPPPRMASVVPVSNNAPFSQSFLLITSLLFENPSFVKPGPAFQTTGTAPIATIQTAATAGDDLWMGHTLRERNTQI